MAMLACEPLASHGVVGSHGPVRSDWRDGAVLVSLSQSLAGSG